jgi:hypothetical protein
MSKLSDFLERHHACAEGAGWANTHGRTPIGAWDLCKNADWLLWAVKHLGIKLSEPRLRRVIALAILRRFPKALTVEGKQVMGKMAKTGAWVDGEYTKNFDLIEILTHVREGWLMSARFISRVNAPDVRAVFTSPVKEAIAKL